MQSNKNGTRRFPMVIPNTDSLNAFPGDTIGNYVMGADGIWKLKLSREYRAPVKIVKPRLSNEQLKDIQQEIEQSTIITQGALQ